MLTVVFILVIEKWRTYDEEKNSGTFIGSDNGGWNDRMCRKQQYGNGGTSGKSNGSGCQGGTVGKSAQGGIRGYD